jgi:hypothetical protein
MVNYIPSVVRLCTRVAPAGSIEMRWREKELSAVRELDAAGGERACRR